MAHLAARITGADGYTALIALGEIAPQFEGKKVLLDHEMNGFSLPGRALRLIVPGDGLGGRSVGDVVRIDVEQTWTVHENEISRRQSRCRRLTMLALGEMTRCKAHDFRE